MKSSGKVISSAQAFGRGKAAEPISGDLIRPGMVVLANGLPYYSPGALIRATNELVNEGPPPADPLDLVAAVLGRLTSERLKAEDDIRAAARAVRA